MSAADVMARVTAWRRRVSIRTTYHRVFETPDGARVLEDMLKGGGMLERSFVPGDPYATAFNEGRRSVMIDVLRLLSWTEGALSKLSDDQVAARLMATEDDE
ncbi:MAG TPA: hypothetical protein VNT30_09370 [Stellaceae bacterium]|nr:hypothetical protein [Stellaceae bacterium]